MPAFGRFKRRVIMGALAIGALPQEASSDDDPHDSVDRAVQALTKIMQKLHGGRWVSHINHDTGFILILRDLAATSSQHREAACEPGLVAAPLPGIAEEIHTA